MRTDWSVSWSVPFTLTLDLEPHQREDLVNTWKTLCEYFKRSRMNCGPVSISTSELAIVIH